MHLLVLTRVTSSGKNTLACTMFYFVNRENYLCFIKYFITPSQFQDNTVKWTIARDNMGTLPCINTYKMAKQKWTQMASVDINIIRR